MMFPAELTLKDGMTFHGSSPTTPKDVFGEVVFNTGMTGYVESLTDPSYEGQILVFTYPLIGNYGVPDSRHWESKKIHARGVIVSEACQNWSHIEGRESLFSWLKRECIPLLTGVDTRALTRHLRESGVMLGAIRKSRKHHRQRTGSHPRREKIENRNFLDPNRENLVANVSIRKKKMYGKGKKIIIAVDCGMKENMIRCLQEFPVTIHRVPHDYDYTSERFDGVLLSNGPGDPARCTDTIAILRQVMKNQKPIFGICLGSQLMALAAGAKTYKLPYGHRGHNQPCQDEKTKRCYLTSQNHGYAVDEQSLPNGWYVNFRNLNDGSVEGIAHKSFPFFSVQFHPEATPGPTDTNGLFQKFYDLL